MVTSPFASPSDIFMSSEVAELKDREHSLKQLFLLQSINVPHSKVPGGQVPASEKFLKKEAQWTLLAPANPRQFVVNHANNTILSSAHVLGADNAPAHKEGASAPGGDAPVAGDSYTSDVGLGSHATNVPSGEQGNVGQKINERPAQ